MISAGTTVLGKLRTEKNSQTWKSPFDLLIISLKEFHGYTQCSLAYNWTGFKGSCGCVKCYY